MPVVTNVLVDVVAVVTVLAVFVADRKLTASSAFDRRIFRMLIALITLVLVFDIPAWLLDGAIFPFARLLLFVLDTLYYLFQIVFCYIWFIFSDSWNSHGERELYRARPLFVIPMIIEIVMILANPVTGAVFTISDMNVYSRGSMYILNLIPYYIYIAGSLVRTFIGIAKAKKPEDKRKSQSFIVFMLLPICGVVIETLFYGISWIWPFTALSLLMAYLSAQQQEYAERRLVDSRRAEEESRLKAELTDKRMAIMLSQIQPHFLYNTLSTIQTLCEIDPMLASRAMLEFTEFLRGNMTSLTSEKPIPFLSELDHTKHYLSLEKLRFGDRLEIVFDIECDCFRVPTLTLQPIVENAVRYGVTKRERGGRITIASYETADSCVLTVTDDGVGFDPELPHEDGRTHIGIANVRDRLSTMCGGSLEIKSAENVGTTATIIVPKEKQT